MIKNKKRILLVSVMVLISLFFLISICNVKKAKADTVDYGEQMTETEEISPRLLTTLNLGIGGKDGEVFFFFSNEFTLGFSTVKVYVELYSSSTYQESYSTMTLEAINYIDDLNIWKSIEVRVPTGGQTRYWQARTRYKPNSSDWAEKVTSVWLFDGNGNVIK